MEGISLFGATPRLNAILAGGFIIPASRITGETPSIAEPPVAGGIPIPEEIHAQGFIESGSAMDLGVIPETDNNIVSAVDHGAQVEDTSASTADIPTGSEHLENIGEFEFLTFFLLF